MGDLDPIYDVVPWLHLTQHLKQHLKSVQPFCTAHGRQSLSFSMGTSFTPKLPISMGISGPHLIRGSSEDPPESSTQMASCSILPFSRVPMCPPCNRQTMLLGLSSNLRCHRQETSSVHSHWDAICTTDSDHAGDEKFRGCGPNHLEQFTSRSAN